LFILTFLKTGYEREGVLEIAAELAGEDSIAEAPVLRHTESKHIRRLAQ
jgi:hypothetical protein